MTPVLQTAITGLVWALSVSMVIIVSTFCTAWMMKMADDKKAVEVEEMWEKLRRKLETAEKKDQEVVANDED